MRRVLALLILVVGCVASLPTLAASGAATVVTLTSRAEPSAVTVAVGETVTIRNQHDDRHRLRARDPEDVDTSDIDPGASAEVAFPVAGRYVLVDERSEDPAYTVTVDVRQPAAAPSSPAPGSTAAPSTGGSSNAGGGTSAPPRSATVSIPDKLFSPRSVTIAAGGTVTWVNSDGSHTVTADDRRWDSGVFDSGRFQHTFPTAGIYGYLCLLHPEMRGTVQVVGSSSGGAPPAQGSTTNPTAAPTAGPTAGPGPAPTGSPTPAAGGRPRRGGGAAVAIDDFAFGPAELRVPAGTTVTWTNRGQALHNVVSTGDGPLGSGYLGTGDTYRARLDRSGTFAYRCELHPGMTGRIVVSATGTSPGPADTPLDGAGTAATEAAADEVASPSPAPTETAATEGSRHTLTIDDLAFAPATLTVAVGDTLLWENAEAVPHTVTSAGDGPLASQMLQEGDRYEVVMTDVGTYAYLCAVHPEMTGEIVVTADAAAATDEEPATAVAAPAGSAPPASTVASSNGDLGPVAAIMLLFMAATFVVGRVTARG